MKTVIDLPDLCPRVVRNRDEIDRLRWFQTKRYFESGLLRDLPTRLPPDPTVQFSTYFGVYSGNKIQATARVIRSTNGLPMLEHHTLYPGGTERLRAYDGSISEISGLAVGSTTPHYRALALLSREFLRYGLANQHASLLVGSIGQPLMRILNRLLGIPLHVIGPTVDRYGEYEEETTPIMIDTVECLQNFQRHESRRWKFFTDGLVIDLTGQTTSPARIDQLERVAS